MNAQEYRSLQEAYLSVYSQDIAESECEDDDESDEKMSKMNSKKKGKKEKEEEKEEESEEEMNEDYDFFDIILEYLVAEGYADTNKAALAIMANMSEEWKQSIVEGLTPLGVKTAGVVDDQRRGSTRDKDLKDTRDSLDKMKAYPKGFPKV